MNRIHRTLAAGSLVMALAAPASAIGPQLPDPECPTKVPAGEEPLIDIARVHPSFLFDIRYATSDNFSSKKVYPQAMCALRKGVVTQMMRAQRWLDVNRPGLRLMFKDCYRPDRVQRFLWSVVKGTGKAGYVADPTKQGSMHSYGAAVDVTLADKTGKELDMGTPYDYLGPLAEPRREEEELANGSLKPEQLKNRLSLRQAMIKAGMRSIPNEWWHFDAAPPSIVRSRYSKLDVPFSAIPDARELLDASDPSQVLEY